MQLLPASPHDHHDHCLQFLRLLRLAKLTRVLRIQRFLRRWESWLVSNIKVDVDSRIKPDAQMLCCSTCICQLASCSDSNVVQLQPMNFSTLKLASFVAITFVCAHWMACGLYMVTAAESRVVMLCWQSLTSFLYFPNCELGLQHVNHYCSDSSCTGKILVASQDNTWLTEYNRGAGHGRVHDAFDIYLVALYWSSMTMSTM